MQAFQRYRKNGSGRVAVAVKKIRLDLTGKKNSDRIRGGSQCLSF